MSDAERKLKIAGALEHAAAEARCDLDATMATLGDDPVYELQPLGRVLRGRDVARRYYEHFFANVVPLVTGYGLRSEWISDEGLLQEYEMTLRNADGAKTAHTIVGILVFGADDKLAGERIYASDELLNIMFGPFLAESTPAG